MIEKYNWKHFTIAAALTIALCIGIFLYSRWDVQHFKESLGEEDPTHASQKRDSTENLAKQTSSRKITLPEASEVETYKQQTNEAKQTDKEAEDTEDASFEDFLRFLDELDDEELAALLASLDLTENEKEAFAEILQQQSDNTPEVYPSTMIVEMIETGVATLAGLIELMEASVSTMSESAQETFQPVLEQLQTLHANGGKLAVYRPANNPSGWYLMYLDLRPSITPDVIRRKLKNSGAILPENIDKIIDQVRDNEGELYLELNDGNTTTTSDDSNTTIIE